MQKKKKVINYLNYNLKKDTSMCLARSIQMNYEVLVPDAFWFLRGFINNLRKERTVIVARCKGH